MLSKVIGFVNITTKGIKASDGSPASQGVETAF